MNRKGMTLIEVMMAVSILTVVLGALFTMSTSLTDTAQVQQGLANAHDQARKGLQIIVKDLRQAANFSFTHMPAQAILYRVAYDEDGNGTAVDVGGNLELSTPRILFRDYIDLNQDGILQDQLIMIGGNSIRVLAKNLAPDEDVNFDGVLNPGEDLNGNGRLDHGIWFERSGSGIRVTIDVQWTSRRGRPLIASLSEVVVPRN